jgi:TPP-dependent pyruvate/acetoin dehydrogenase alpha subunit
MSAVPVPAAGSPLPEALRLQLLRGVKRIRHAEEQIAAKYPEGKMRCPTHLSIGQEAVATGVCTALRRDDLAVSSHRGHAHYLAKGGDLKSMLAEIYGKKTGCAHGRGGSMHLVDHAAGFTGSTAIVANSVPIGVGVALAMQLRGEDRISCIFIGDAVVETGVFHEAANFAVVRKLPVLFICENNLYSVYSPLSVRQPPGRVIHKLAEAIGLRAAGEYGNDVEAVFRSAARAAAEVRSGTGPQFLEYATYRWREHCGPNYDDDLRYRAEGEVREWLDRDPVATYEQALLKQRVASAEQVRSLQREIEDEVRVAFAFAESSPFPDAAEAFSGVYREA